MSLFGIHIKVFDDQQWSEVIKPALLAAGIDPATVGAFTKTQAAIAHLLSDDPLVQIAKKAIEDARDTNLSSGEKLAKAAQDVIPGLIDFFANGGVKTEAGELTSLATTFVQEVYNNAFSRAIAGAVDDVETIFKAKA